MEINQKSLVISFHQIQLSDYSFTQNAVCQINYKEKYTQKVKEAIINTENSNLFRIAIADLDQGIQLIIKNLQCNQIIGSITFPLVNFIACQTLDFDQWVTLFDDAEDDIYDGELTEPDEEPPRALFHFSILNNRSSAQSTEQSMCIHNKTNDVLDSLSQITYSPSGCERRCTNSQLQINVTSSESENVLQNQQQQQQLPQYVWANTINALLHNSGASNSPNNINQLQEGVCQYRFLPQQLQENNQTINYDGSITNENSSKIDLLSNEYLMPLQIKSLNDKSRHNNNIAVKEQPQKNDLLIQQLESINSLKQKNSEIKASLEKYEKNQEFLIKQYEESVNKYEIMVKFINDENLVLKAQITQIQNEHLNQEMIYEQALKNEQQANQNAIEELMRKIQRVKTKKLNYKALVNDLSNQNQSQQKYIDDLKQQQQQMSLIHNDFINKLEQCDQQYTIDNNKSQIQEQREQQNFKLQYDNTNLNQQLKKFNEERQFLLNQNQNLQDQLQKLNSYIITLEQDKENNSMLFDKEIERLQQEMINKDNQYEVLQKQNLCLSKKLIYYQSEIPQAKIQVLQQQIINLQQLLTENEKSRTIMQQNLNQINQKFKEKNELNNESQQPPNKDNEKDSNNVVSSNINSNKEQATYDQKLKDLLHQNFQKSQMIHNLTHINQELQIQVTSKNQQLIINEYQLKFLDELKHKLFLLGQDNDQLQKDNFNLAQENMAKTQENMTQMDFISNLQQKNEKYNKAIQIILKNACQYYIPVQGDQVDEILANYINIHAIPIKFVKLQEGFYNYGKCRVNIQYDQNDLVCTLLDQPGQYTIEQFIQLFTNKELVQMKNDSDFSQLAFPPLSIQQIDQIIDNQQFNEDLCIQFQQEQLIYYIFKQNCMKQDEEDRSIQQNQHCLAEITMNNQNMIVKQKDKEKLNNNNKQKSPYKLKKSSFINQN